MIRYFGAHPTAANLLMVLFIAIGVASLPSLKRETLPDFAAQEVQVRVPYPGAAALDVEVAICERIEDALDAVTDLEELTCVAAEGAGVAVARMAEGADIGDFLDQVRTEVEAIDSFPEESEAPVVAQLGLTDRVVSVAVTGPMSERDLLAYAEDLADRLRTVPQISQVEVAGFSDHQFLVEVRGAALRTYGLSIDDVLDAVARQNVDLPAGSVATRDQDVLLRFADLRRGVAGLADLRVVGESGGAEVRLGDLATITDRFALDEEKILFDGRRAALLEITKTKSEDALEVVDAVREFVEAERARVPPGVRLQLTDDIASIVRDRLRMLVRNGWQGLVLVFLAMWLFFRVRLAFWVAAGLPVSFLGAFFLMGVLGLSINMITMVALLISLGLLMDDAIVIAENVAAHLERGRGALAAAVEGTRQVAPGVLSSFLTTLAVFGPLAFLSGDIGKVLKFIPMVLIMVLLVSLVEAFLILPSHLAHALHGHVRDEPGRFRRRFEAALSTLRERVAGRAVDAAVAHRYLFAGLVVAALMASIGMLAGGRVKFEAFPEIEGDLIEARVLLSQGAPLARTESVVAQLTAALERVNAEFSPRQPGGASLVRSVSVRFNRNLRADEQGGHVATVAANLLTAEAREGRIEAVIERWREETGPVPDAISIGFADPTIGPAGRAIDIRLTGTDLGTLRTAAGDLAAWLDRYRGVEDLDVDLRAGKPELRIRLEEGALSLGLDAAGVARQLRTAFQGATADEIQVRGASYDVEVRLGASDRDTLADVADFHVSTPAGDQVPLAAVATLASARGFAKVRRIDGVRTVTVSGDVDGRLANAAEIIEDTRARFVPDLEAAYPGVRVSLEGQRRESERTGASMARGFALGLLGIFMILSFQFRSYVEPLVVMLSIPVALVGVVWGHWIMGLNLSMPSVMGFVSLAGIVVNDSILLVEFLKRHAREGRPVPEAARRASRDRFRAVLLTSVTTILGLLPLLTERSLQAQILIPLATSIVFGLLATTVLVLLLVPVLYTILSDLGWHSLEGDDVDSSSPAAA